MKRGRAEVAEQNVIHVYFSSTVLKLVLPFLFVGHYDANVFLCFRTYLALAGVCKKLRYWNHLRRWIGWLCPEELRTKLGSHSFDVPLEWYKYGDLHEHMRQELRTNGALDGVLSPLFTNSKVIDSLKSGARQGDFEIDIAGTPFFNCSICYALHPDMATSRKIFCWFAPSFAELVLICYSIMSQDRTDVYAYLLMCSWKTDKKGQYACLYFEDSNKEKFLNKFLLGRLKRLGLYAKQEIGFHQGGLPVTSFGWFCKTCDTNGARNGLKALERLHAFVVGWFPTQLFYSTPCKIKFAYEIPINFY